jgi:hypothetical protein
MGPRSLIAVLGGIVITYFLSGILEGPLVGMVAAERPTNMEELMAARNEPAVVAGRIAIAGFVGLLAGYLVAKIAGEYEVPHAAVAAALQAVILVRGFAADPAAASVALWMHGAHVLVTAGAMIGGALIRARAARVGPPGEVRS